MEFLVLFVFEFSVIHNTTDGRLRRRRHLHQIEALFGGLGDGLPRRQDAELFSLDPDDPDFPNPDFVIDTLFDRDSGRLLSLRWSDFDSEIGFKLG